LDRARTEREAHPGIDGHSSIQQTFDVYGYLFEAKDDDRTGVNEIAVRLLKGHEQSPNSRCSRVAWNIRKRRGMTGNKRISCDGFGNAEKAISTKLSTTM